MKNFSLNDKRRYYSSKVNSKDLKERFYDKGFLSGYCGKCSRIDVQKCYEDIKFFNSKLKNKNLSNIERRFCEAGISECSGIIKGFKSFTYRH